MGVLVARVIPAVNDHEIPSVLAAAKPAGASRAGTEILRLPLTVVPNSEQWLERTLPGKKEKALGRIRAIRGGKLNDLRFGSRMTGEGIFADQISQIFHVACRGVFKRRQIAGFVVFKRRQGHLGRFENRIVGLALGSGAAARTE